MSVGDACGLLVTGVARRGKVLIVALGDEAALLVHLRMTGQLLLDEDGSREGPMTRAVIHLDHGDLVFNDQRKFGRIIVTPARLVGADPLLARMGPEPLASDFDATVLATQLGRHRPLSIKAALLDQSTIAGIGNIYADEVLFCAGIHPAVSCDALDAAAIDRLAGSIVSVLQRAIEAGGSTMRDYRDATGATGGYLDHALVFGRTDERCRRCSTAIVKIRVAGRGTHLCPRCQPVRRSRRA